MTNIGEGFPVNPEVDQAVARELYNTATAVFNDFPQLVFQTMGQRLTDGQGSEIFKPGDDTVTFAHDNPFAALQIYKEAGNEITVHFSNTLIDTSKTLLQLADRRNLFVTLSEQDGIISVTKVQETLTKIDKRNVNLPPHFETNHDYQISNEDLSMISAAIKEELPPDLPPIPDED